MRLSKALVLLVVVALLSVSLVFLLFSYANRLPEGTRTVPYLFHIAENPGIDAGTDIFRLGAVTPGGGSSRTLTVGGAADSLSPKEVTVFVRGEGAEWLSVIPATVTLPGTVEIRLAAPDDAPMGTYRGEVLIVPIGTVNN